MAAWQRGLALAEQQDWWGSIAAFDEAIRLDPLFSKAYQERGNSFLAAGNTIGAMGDYNRAISLDPKDGLAYYNRGNLYLQQEDYYRAIDDYGRALLYGGPAADALQNQGIALAAVGELEQAVTKLQQAARLYERSGDRAGWERSIAALRLLQPGATLQPAPASPGSGTPGSGTPSPETPSRETPEPSPQVSPPVSPPATP